MFSLFSSDVVEFESTFKNDQTVDLQSRGVSTDPPADKCDAVTNTISPRSVSMQTESPIVGVVPLRDGNEKKLAQWLQKILPLVEEELKMGISPCPQGSSRRESQSAAKISFIECLNIKVPNVPSGKLIKGAATWLSLATGGAPALAVACTTTHDSWCEHNTPSVVVFTPKRKDLQSSGLGYGESHTIPVKSCIQILSTNTYNRDIFAGGTVLGDLYIWQQEQHQGRDTARELYSGTTHSGEIVAMTWLKLRPAAQDVNLLTCHSDGVVESWKILANLQVVHEKTFRISTKHHKHPTIDYTPTLRAITSIDDRSEFVIGCEDGRVILCSANQLSTIRGAAKNVYDPVIADLESHQFPVTSLQMITHSGKQLLASCDLTGEVYFHDVMRSTAAEPVVVLRMPLPFKNTIAIGRNLQFIVSPGEFGSLEIFTATSGQKTSIDGNLRGKGNLLAISSNSEWIVTGVYEGNFNIYRIY